MLSAALAVALLAAPLAADAQPPKKVQRIGILSLATGPGSRTEAFRQGLRELGYVEGQNIAIEAKWAEQREDRLPLLATELARSNVNVIVTEGTLATRAAVHATQTIPIVMAFTADPVGTGFVAHLARPGGNVTGLSSLAGELSGKRLELVREVVPGSSRVAVLFNPATPAVEAQLKETELAAQTLGVKLQPLEVRDPKDMERAFSAAVKGQAGAFTVVADPLIAGHRTRILQLAGRHRLPGMYYAREWAEAGGLMAYGVSYAELFRRAATYVDKLLKGAKPADLPIEQPTRFELVVNLKTAKTLGLAIPQSILIRADQVIQ
jgi:putative ABC transport system substrate-binding protein